MIESLDKYCCIALKPIYNIDNIATHPKAPEKNIPTLLAAALKPANIPFTAFVDFAQPNWNLAQPELVAACIFVRLLACSWVIFLRISLWYANFLSLIPLNMPISLLCCECKFEICALVNVLPSAIAAPILPPFARLVLPIFLANWFCAGDAADVSFTLFANSVSFCFSTSISASLAFAAAAWVTLKSFVLGIKLLRIEDANNPIAIAALVVLLAINLAIGSAIPAIIGLNLFSSSSKAIPTCDKAFAVGSMISLIFPNFSSACPSTSFTTACDFWYIESWFLFRPSAAAYFVDASSSLNIIPNSSNSSGSALVTPLTNLLNESVTSRPSATETVNAASDSSLNCPEESPAALPIAAACDASEKLTIPLVASWISFAKDLYAIPVEAEKACCPCVNTRKSAAPFRNLKAASRANKLAAKVA